MENGMKPGEGEIVELVNAVIDGVATAEQRDELDRLMASSPEVRQQFESELDIVRRLEGMREVEPPRELRIGVLQHLQRSSSVGRGGATLHRATSQRRATFAALWAAAAMLVLGFFIFERSQMTDTAATMAPAWPVVRTVTAPRVTLLVRRSGDLWALEAVPGLSRPQIVTIGWDDSKVSLIGVLNDKDASFRKTSVEFTLRDRSERAGVVLRPRRGATAATVVVSAGSTEVLRTVVAFE